MESALIVSYSTQNLESIMKLLRKISCSKIETAKTCGEARRMASEYNFDVYIINSPVYTDSGESLVKELISYDACQVIYVVKSDVYEYMSSLVEDLGVLTISKPLNKEVIWTTLKLAKATFARLNKIQKQNVKLAQKIEHIKTIDRAKCLLISHLSMNEKEAHKYIEKKSMNARVSRLEIAERILKTYES